MGTRSREEQEDIDRARLGPFADRVVRLRCCCGNTLDELKVRGWIVESVGLGWHPGIEGRRRYPGVSKTISMGPLLPLKYTYSHSTRRCHATHETIVERLVTAFVLAATQSQENEIQLRS